MVTIKLTDDEAEIFNSILTEFNALTDSSGVFKDDQGELYTICSDGTRSYSGYLIDETRVINKIENALFCI